MLLSMKTVVTTPVPCKGRSLALKQLINIAVYYTW